jgi:predicted esterase
MKPTLQHTAINAMPALQFTATEARSEAVIIWLHGSGERGTDPSVVARYGLPAELASQRAVLTCDLICPQIQDEGAWDSDLIRSVVRGAKQNYKNVVLVGYSLGGVGVLNAIAEFGAICSLHVAIASLPPRAPTASQTGVRLVSIQGELDLQPEVSSFVAKVRELGANAVEAVVREAGHYISDLALWEPVLQTALHEHGIRLYPNAA